MRAPPSQSGIPTRAELLDGMDRSEREIRRLGSRWADHLPAPERAQLLRAANRLFRLLMRAGRR